ncbi:hypothetical protein [uncultured Alistipes sp.]|uniref:hypothetical protein n=1 Tax=uncultured Alistipes sp. TaxID=538949 RepID=UPI0026701116|nr:hypothetical protein [uncultured Alistipes sp.]
MQIVDLFYNLARECRRIRGFAYGRAAAKGAGNDAYPLLWLDDPIMARREGGALFYTVNFDVLGIPEEQTDAAIASVQGEALETACILLEHVQRTRGTHGFTVRASDLVSVRSYYDDAAAGWRCTAVLAAPLPLDRCGDYFDEDGTLPMPQPLPVFSADDPSGCAVFSEKPGLPSFKMTDDE